MSRREAPAHGLVIETPGVERTSPSARLRELLAQPTILEQPTVCDPLGARTAAATGYQAVTLPGFAIGAHLPGDTLLSLADIERTVRRVAESCGVPLLLDADIAWDPEHDLRSAVRRLATAGAAGILLSSQHLPEAVPLRDPGERRRAHDDLLGRVRVAADSGTDVLITARCDIDAADGGFAVALDRAGELLDAGVETLVVHSADDAALERLPAELPGTWLSYAASPALPGRPSVYPVAQLETWGYAAVSNKYHHCYCARTAPCPERAPREPYVAGRG